VSNKSSSEIHCVLNLSDRMLDWEKHLLRNPNQLSIHFSLVMSRNSNSIWPLARGTCGLTNKESAYYLSKEFAISSSCG
jgi:hypothetical protein